MTQTEALKLALEALRMPCKYWNKTQYIKVQEAIEVAEKALAQPEEAQSALSLFQSGFIDGREKGLKEALAQPQRKPLTDEEIMEIGRELGLKCRLGGNPNIDFDYARAIEAAHGIKETEK